MTSGSLSKDFNTWSSKETLNSVSCTDGVTVNTPCRCRRFSGFLKYRLTMRMKPMISRDKDLFSSSRVRALQDKEQRR